MIASFIAQGLSSHEAALAGVFIHGVAGEIASASRPFGMTAGDLAEAIPAAMRKILTDNELKGEAMQ